MTASRKFRISAFVVLWLLVFGYESLRYNYLGRWLGTDLPKVLFLFPPMLLLFVEPETLLAWLERRRELWRQRGRARLIYDGGCGFCRASLARILALDPTGRIEPVDFRSVNVARLHPALTPEACHARMYLLEPGGRLDGGFHAFRRLTLWLPMLWPLAPFLNLPGLELIGTPIYDWVSRNRFNLLHRSHTCGKNACVRPHTPPR
ncbi:MAG: DUF393 domain-containing protein [Verrucomicrobia bacterium]|nr:DUF393 domain-containing protein [Verrucomicrobiota bacterium]